MQDVAQLRGREGAGKFEGAGLRRFPVVATTGAIDSFTIGLARKVATEGARVNVVTPGLIDTPLHAANELSLRDA